MKYRNADTVFPAPLLAEIQKYMKDGGIIYIPKSKDTRKKWGENTGYRKYIKERNDIIREKFRVSGGIDNLADEYNLSAETVKKIVYGK